MASLAYLPGPVTTTAVGHHPTRLIATAGAVAGQSPQVSRIHSRTGRPTVRRMPK